jgi:hypothetical protein
MYTNNYFYLLITILAPLIPAYVLYRQLPAKTSVVGPFKGLSIKLSGAFAGYFLLVLLTIALALKMMQDDKEFSKARFAQDIEQLRADKAALTQQINHLTSLFETWTIEGQVISKIPEKTKIFVDSKSVHLTAAGDFDATMLIKKENGKVELPKALCVFNWDEGYKVLRLTKTATTNDLGEYNIRIDEIGKKIVIGKPIALQQNLKN